MNEQRSDRTLPRIGGVALLAAPLLLLLGNLMRLGIGGDDNAELLAEVTGARGRFYAGTVLTLIGLAVLAGAVVRLVALARMRDGADWWALIGGGFAIVGLLASTNIVTFDIVMWLMTDSANDAAAMVALAETAEDSAGFTIAVLLPGLAFPVGLFLIAIALWRSPIAPRWAPIILAVGAVMLLTDAVLLVGLGALAVDTLRETVAMPEGT